MSKPKHKNEEIFTGYLQEDEDLLWIGNPNPYRVFHKSDIWVIPIALAFFVLALGMVFGAIRVRNPIMIDIAFIYLLLGTMFIAKRYYSKHRDRLRTHYALTQERAFIVQNKVNNNVNAIFLHSIHFMNIQERVDGSGTILFDFMNTPDENTDFFDNRDQGIGFHEIDDVRSVYKLINDLRK